MTVQAGAGAGVMPCPDGKSRVAVQFSVDNSQYMPTIGPLPGQDPLPAALRYPQAVPTNGHHG